MEPVPVLSLQLQSPLVEGSGVLVGQGSVSMSVANARDVVVSLASILSSKVQVPAGITIPAGEFRATFDVNVLDDAILDGAQWVLVSASASGIVSMSRVAEAPVSVSLRSSPPGELWVPATVVIPAGQSSVSFLLRAVDDNRIDGTQSAVVSARVEGWTDASAAVSVSANASGFVGGNRLMTVWDDEVHHFEFAPVGVTQVRGVPFAVTVTAKDINNVTVPRFTGSLPLGAITNGGSLAASPSVAGPFASGVWSGNVTVNGFDLSVVLRVADASGREGLSNPFSVGSGVLDHFGWSISGGTQFSGYGFPARIVAQDVANNTVSGFSGSTSLKIAEAGRTIGTGSVNSSAFPLYTYYHDQRSQCIYLQSEVGGAGTIRSLSLNVSTLPGQTMNGWTIYRRHTDLQSYGTAPEWEAADWTTVYQSNETISRTGWVTFRFTTPFAYDGVRNLMVDFSFNNNSWTRAGAVLATNTVQPRRIQYFTDSGFGDPLAWAGRNPLPSVSGVLPNVQLGFERALQVAPTSTGNFSNGIWDGVITVRGVGTDVALLADDGSGRQGQSAAFNIVALAPTVGSAAVSGVGTTSATLSGLVNPKGTPTSAAFEVGPTSSYGLSLPVTVTPADGIEAQSVSVVLNGLNPGTEYHGRLVGNNLGGSSVGEDVTFRTVSINADLAELAVSGGTLSPGFLSGVTSYAVSVPYATSGLSVTPVVADATASVKVNGVSVASGSASVPVALVVGLNPVLVEVTAQDGVTVKTYTVGVTRAVPSTNANLAGLTPSAGSLSPVFRSTVSDYALNFTTPVVALRWRPLTQQSGASVRVNGILVGAGQWSGVVGLGVGETVVGVEVTAEDGVTKKSYSVRVNRPAGSNPGLSGLRLSAVALSPAFASGTTQYSAKVLNVAGATSVLATAAQANATIRLNGMAIQSGSWSSAVPLAEGVNSLEVVVTAEDGVSSRKYVMEVLRQPEFGGGYDGLVVPSGNSVEPMKHVGLAGVSLSSSGYFSGRLIFGGTSTAVPFSGVMDAGGAASFYVVGSAVRAPAVEIVRAGFDPLSLTMRVDWQSPLTHQLVGEVRSGSLVVSEFVLNRRLYTSAAAPVSPLRNVPVTVLDPLTDKGAYTMVFPAWAPAVQGREANTYPQGSGFATATVYSTGAVSVWGELADGQVFSVSNYLSKENRLPLYAAPYAGRGVIAGEVSFREVPAKSDVDGEAGLRWYKAANASDVLYPEGWSQEIGLDLVGSKFIASALTTKTVLGNEPAVYPAVNGLLEVGLGGLQGAFRNQLTIGRTSVRVQGAPAGGVPAAGATFGLGGTGRWSGTFVYPGTTGVGTAFRGAVLQKTQRGEGYFVAPVVARQCARERRGAA